MFDVRENVTKAMFKIIRRNDLPECFDVSWALAIAGMYSYM